MKLKAEISPELLTNNIDLFDISIENHQGKNCFGKDHFDSLHCLRAYLGSWETRHRQSFSNMRQKRQRRWAPKGFNSQSVENSIDTCTNLTNVSTFLCNVFL